MSETEYGPESRTQSIASMVIRQDKVVQKLFFVSGLIMLVGLPVFASTIRITLLYAMLGIVFVAIFASLTSNRSRLLMLADIIISVLGAVAFEFTAIGAYASDGQYNYFLFNQLLAVLFFVCIYFSTRSLKNMFWRKA